MNKNSALRVKFLSIFVVGFTLMACRQPSAEETMAELRKAYKIDFHFSPDSIPKSISAKTTDGKIFNSKDLKGKYWVVLGYDKNYLKPGDSKVINELNANYEKYKDKVAFIGIIDGFIDNQKELDTLLKQTKVNFPQIDNTKSVDKVRIINHDIYCWPVKIIINPEGKVIYEGCGGGSYGLDQQLDQLIDDKKI